ncbi:MAG: B-box zinc finger protein [Archangium sp.]|nr:B-box zinc finger protein [Archangium sp.]
MLKTVFKSPIRAEAELIRSRLEGAGFHPAITGAALHNSLMPMLMEVESEVAVPESEHEDAVEFLSESRLKLEGTAASGEIVEGSVCPVHEQPAVAACDRCGTFLCARCGSLGVPPLCEDCVVRQDKPRERPRWVTFVARLWFVFWVGPPLIVALIAMLAWLFRSTR